MHTASHLKSAIIIGASTGIGRALALAMAADGYWLGLTARRVDLLDELADAIQARSSQGSASPITAPMPPRALVRQMDVSDAASARAAFQALAEELSQQSALEIVVINAGVGVWNPHLDWNNDETTIGVNALGFAAIANAAYHFFRQQIKAAAERTQSQHQQQSRLWQIVGVSSVAGTRGLGHNPAYSASKAFASSYLQGLRQKAGRKRLPIVVTDIRPGFVDTPMTEGNNQKFWSVSAETAARQMWRDIQRKRRTTFVTRRWRYVTWLWRLLPNALYNRLG
jgi:short-subunit dehydrogenase